MGAQWFRLLPVVTSNLCSMWGLLFLHWDVADLYFWFWYEVAVAGLIVVVLVILWNRGETTPGNIRARRNTVFSTLLAYALVMFYASLFTGLAYMGEWKSWHRFPEFIAGKELEMAAVVVAFGIGFLMVVRKPFYGAGDCEIVEAQFTRRAWVVLALYFVMIERYHLVDGATLELSPAYLKFMGVTLVLLKATVETGLVQRVFRRSALAKA